MSSAIALVNRDSNIDGGKVKLICEQLISANLYVDGDGAPQVPTKVYKARAGELGGDVLIFVNGLEDTFGELAAGELERKLGSDIGTLHPSWHSCQRQARAEHPHQRQRGLPRRQDTEQTYRLCAYFGRFASIPHRQAAHPARNQQLVLLHPGNTRVAGHKPDQRRGFSHFRANRGRIPHPVDN